MRCDTEAVVESSRGQGHEREKERRPVGNELVISRRVQAVPAAAHGCCEAEEPMKGWSADERRVPDRTALKRRCEFGWRATRCRVKTLAGLAEAISRRNRPVG